MAHRGSDGDPELGISIPEVCGPVWWGSLHAIAAEIRDKGCSSCGQEAVELVSFIHDLTNLKLGKPIYDPANFQKWLDKIGKVARDYRQTHRRNGIATGIAVG